MSGQQQLATRFSFLRQGWFFIVGVVAVSLIRKWLLSQTKPERRQDFRRARSRNPDFRDIGGRRNNSRPHRGNRDSRPQRNNERQVKPDLWAAVERSDEAGVQQLLALGKDPDEKFEGWSPLMKSAEEGKVEIMRMLLANNVDLEAINKNGRTALSFAAAPSNNGSEVRPTPVATLRLLLESGAKTQHKDATGVTAKGRAVREKRYDAVAIFEEFSLKSSVAELMTSALLGLWVA